MSTDVTPVSPPPPPAPAASTLRSRAMMTMDWVDLLLLLAMVGLYKLVFASHDGGLGISGSKVTGGAYFAAIVARRRIFGMPDRGPPREGFVWSLAGIGALFLLLGGIIAVGFAASIYESSRDSAPDVTAQAERAADDKDAVDRVFDLPTPQLIRSSEDEAAAAKARADADAAKEAQRRVDHQASVQEYVEKSRADWQQQQGESRSRALNVLLVGLLMFALGVAADTARYGAKIASSAGATSR